MKKIKINLSKTSWIILSVGIFIVVLAGLGVTYSQQVKEKNEVEEQLEFTEMRLEMFNIAELEHEKATLDSEVSNATYQHDSLRNNLSESVVSSDVVEKCYEIAEDSNVTVINISSTAVKAIEIAAVECLAINLNMNVTGQLADYVIYIQNLNEEFTTGYVSSFQFQLEENHVAMVQLVVYSYEGE